MMVGWFIAYLDDASRFVTAYGMFNEATSQHAIEVLQKAIAQHGKPSAIVTDRGTQFYANESQYRKKCVSAFEDKLAELEIKHIVTGVRHPQTNGKIERFFGEVQRKLPQFVEIMMRVSDPVDLFMKWYNYERPLCPLIGIMMKHLTKRLSERCPKKERQLLTNRPERNIMLNKEGGGNYFSYNRASKNAKKQFSIVVPFYDNEKSRRFAVKSIPAIIKLHPEELVVGVDTPMKESLSTLIHNLCKNSSVNLRIIQVKPDSQEWNFALAKVLWECYKACKNEKILACDIDVVLQPIVLTGYDIVGTNNIALVSFQKKTRITSYSKLLRDIGAKILMSKKDGFAGLYWINKTNYFENIDLTKFKQIHNGVDGFMYDEIKKKDTHKIVTKGDIGAKSLDIENEERPWRLFQQGVWLYAHRNEIHNKKIRTGIIYKLKKTHPIIKIIVDIVNIGLDYWVIRGIFWAYKNKNDTTVQIAGSMTNEEWGMTGSKYIEDILDWKKYNKERITGFG